MKHVCPRFALPLLFALVVVLPHFGFAQNPEVLLHFPQPAQIRALSEVPLAICLRTDSYALGTLRREMLTVLRQRGVAFTVLDEAAFSQPYYLLHRKPQLAAKILPRAERLLWQENETGLYKMSDTEAQSLARAGWQLTRIFPRALPFKEERSGFSSKPQRNSANAAVIKNLNVEISDSSVTAYLKRLEAFRTRFSFSDSIVAAREWLLQQFLSMGYNDARFEPVPVFGSLQQNVVASKRGTINPERVIVLGGHYDSILFDADPAQFAPGVDDDGTGTAGTLEIARVLAGTDLESTIIFVPFAAEEQGLWGSEAFAAQASANGMNLALMLNLDMIGNVADQVSDLFVLTDTRARGYAQLFAHLTTQHTNLIPVIGGSSGNSDHFPFQQFGFPALFIHEHDFSPNWHLTSDVLSNVNVPYATSVLKATLAMIVTVANTPDAPQGFTAIETGDGRSQILQWQPNRESDFASYRLYLGKSSGVYDDVRTLTANSDTLRNLITEQTMFAALSAVDSDGNESLLSPEIAFTPRTVPLALATFEATSRKQDIRLVWPANNREVDFAGYTITRIGPGNAEQRFVLTGLAGNYHDASVQPHVLYLYSVQARDHDGNLSAPSPVQRGRLATHDRGILIVDGTKDGASRPLQPSDEEVDAFYVRLTQGYNLAGQWDLADSARISLAMSDADLGIYSTVIWHSDVNLPTRRLASDTLALKKYLQNGGRLILCGWALAESMVGRNFVENNFAPGQFGYDYLRIATTRISSGADRDFKGADAGGDGFPSVTIDPTKVTVFNGNLLAMETFSALAPGAEAIYTYRSSAQPPSIYHGRPVALKYLSAEFKMLVFDFPLYFLQEADARLLMQQALSLFGEISSSVTTPATALPERFEMEQSYPNPVRFARNINAAAEPVEIAVRYHLPSAAQISLRIYNLLGQTVRTLVQKQLAAGTQLARWNGRDDNGRLVQPGIYFCEMTTPNFRQVRKLVVMP